MDIVSQSLPLSATSFHALVARKVNQDELELRKEGSSANESRRVIQAPERREMPERFPTKPWWVIAQGPCCPLCGHVRYQRQGWKNVKDDRGSRAFRSAVFGKDSGVTSTHHSLIILLRLTNKG